MKIFIFLLICVASVFTVPIENNNEKKYINSTPTIEQIKLLEKEILVSTTSGNIPKAIRLENRLEKDILKAALNALINSKKEPLRSKREIQELKQIVKRDKRTIQMLSSFASASSNPLSFLSPFNKLEKDAESNKALIRKTRQYNFPKTEVELTNEIFPPTSTIPTTTIVVTTENFENNSTTVPPAKQQDGEEDEEEGGGGLGGLITSFLGSLSTPEGGVDLDAVTGLLGGISTQNDDGTFDFTGLQDTVGSLFGGSEEGGSNVGLFLGGLLGAVIRGSAGEQGAKGAGRLVANILTAILPGLSAFPTPEDNGDAMQPEGLNSGGFIAGFLKTILGGLGGLSNSNSSGGGGQGSSGKPILQIKFQIFKSIFSAISKILGASSTSKQHPQQPQH